MAMYVLRQIEAAHRLPVELVENNKLVNQISKKNQIKIKNPAPFFEFLHFSAF